MLTKDTGGDGKSADAETTAAQTTSAPSNAQDASSTSASAIQAAHMGAGSHFSIQHAGANADPTTGDLRSTVGTAAFNDELGGKLTWMAHQGVETGSLQLSPEHLGPLEVRIQVQNGAASVWFGANHADTRAALEQALPHLRQMFANQGLTLSDAGVSRESPRGQPQKPASSSVSAIGGVGGTEQQSVVSLSGRRSGLLDTYA
jgi:flagellar hook-length control protein FliK